MLPPKNCDIITQTKHIIYVFNEGYNWCISVRCEWSFSYVYLTPTHIHSSEPHKLFLGGTEWFALKKKNVL